MSNVYAILEQILGDKIVNSNGVGGGCIANAQKLVLQSGKQYFLKSLEGAAGMFEREANGLNELARSKAIRVPMVKLVGENFLLLELINQGGKPSTFFSEFGEALAQMHRYTNAEFGFFEDNYIGSSPQYNEANGNEAIDWASFYLNKRLVPQLKMAEKNGYASNELTKGISKLESLLPKILEGSEEAPSLLHGDLWGGNFICDEKGKAVLIDPAVYYGHREADLAMTKMFGGFSPDFFETYQLAHPLKEGWEYRENLYLLYHYLNHLNLFGTGYYSQCLRLINYYIR